MDITKNPENMKRLNIPQATETREMPENIDLNKLSSFLVHLSKLTGLALTLYSDRGNVLLPSFREDKFLSAVKSSQKGDDQYHDFLNSYIEKVIHKEQVCIFEGPAKEHHLFIPICMNDDIFIIAGGGIYFSLEEFKEFYSKDGEHYGLLPEKLKMWSEEIVVGDYDYVTLHELGTQIQYIANLLLRYKYEGSLNEKRYRLTKSILSLISDIELDMQVEQIYDMLADILLFLFDADSVSVIVKDNGTFSVQKAAGRLRDALQTMKLKEVSVLSKTVLQKKPVYSEDLMEILRLGLPDDVASIYVFPITIGDEAVRLLGIFNSHVSQEDADIISELCKIGGLIIRLVEMNDMHDKRKKYIDILHVITSRLNEVKEPEALYEAVVEISAHLTDAERVSLMLAEDDLPFFTVKATRGINKKLLKELKIKVDEGIAGKVFSERVPCIVQDIEKDERILSPRRPTYRTGSFISIPLKIGERAMGVLNVSDKVGGEFFTEEDLHILYSFASYVSVALERSKYYNLVAYVKELTITDPLTGLFKKHYFDERFFEELQRSERHNLSFSVAILDIDDLKLFNDTEGNPAGDAILKNIANIAKENTRVIDIVVRFGGEEFAIIMPQTEKDEAFFVTERIRKAVREQLPHTWRLFPKERVTITAGVATYPSDGKDMKDLIRNADKALYTGKMEGKDRTVLYME